MQAAFEKIIEKLEEELKLADEEKLRCARENPLQFDSAKGYAHGVGKAIEIVKQEAEQYEECYKDCGECEAYNKEKHHCPKFCKVIKETVKEIEENHNGFNEISEKGLPPVGKPLIVTIKDNLQGRPNELRYPVYYEKDSMKGGYHWSWRYGDFAYELVPDVSEVIAWQPLPQPYTKGE